MKIKFKYFRLGDIFIYIFLVIVFLVLFLRLDNFKNLKASKAEIWVDNQLKYVYDLVEEEKLIFVDTALGGCYIEFKDYKVRVKTSNSPLKIAVKQGYISSPGEVLIGIPDRLVVKIIGESEEGLDFIAR